MTRRWKCAVSLLLAPPERAVGPRPVEGSKRAAASHVVDGRPAGISGRRRHHSFGDGGRRSPPRPNHKPGPISSRGPTTSRSTRRRSARARCRPSRPTCRWTRPASSKQNGDAKRGVNFKGDISVRVIAVDKTGLLQIKGTKVVDVDKNKQSLNFTGWVRPEDVSPQNFVGSERVADAALTYSLSGDIGKTRGGIIGRILNVFWP